MKKLLIGLIGIALLMTAFSVVQYKIYLPIVFKTDPPVYEWHSCTYDELYDNRGFNAGYVKVWLKIEYHPSGPVRLVQFYDTFEPATYTWTYFKWYARPSGFPPFEINLLWIEPVGNNKNWNATFVESISAWETITHLGANNWYTMNPVAFKKGHSRYPIDCIIIRH